jgi:hypothetical protein
MRSVVTGVSAGRIGKWRLPGAAGTSHPGARRSRGDRSRASMWRIARPRPGMCTIAHKARVVEEGGIAPTSVAKGTSGREHRLLPAVRKLVDCLVRGRLPACDTRVLVSRSQVPARLLPGLRLLPSHLPLLLLTALLLPPGTCRFPSAVSGTLPPVHEGWPKAGPSAANGGHGRRAPNPFPCPLGLRGPRCTFVSRARSR